MSGFDRAVGLARSLAIYRAVPFRARQLRAVYAPFVRAGDLVFDIGGHVGNRTSAFLQLGCRVVVVEPQPDCVRLLRRRFARDPHVTLIESAVSDTVGTVTLAISERTPTVSTISRDWRAARMAEAGFASVEWNRTIDVTATTLDRLIQEYGEPSFIKIDVEGAEPDVIRGLNRAVAALSFEYLLTDLDRTRHALDHLQTLDDYRFNWSVGESGVMAVLEWVRAEPLLAAIASAGGPCQSGDVYARRWTRRTP